MFEQINRYIYNRPWSGDEIKKLVQYVALFHEPSEIVHGGKPWPCTKDESFWQKCADYINKLTGLPLRSGN